MNEFVDKAAILQVLGSLIQRPQYLSEIDKYTLIPTDFPTFFDQSIFVAIDGLYKQGAKTIAPIDVENYLTQNHRASVAFAQNHGLEYLRDAIALAQVDNFPYYYTKIKKLNLLRDLKKKGFDTTSFYQPDLAAKDAAEINQKFEDLTTQDICDAIRKTLSTVTADYAKSEEIKIQSAAEGFRSLFTRLGEEIEIGLPLPGAIYSQIIGGAQRQSLTIRSGSSGLGKALPNTTIIPTTKGWRTVGQIRCGDYLFDAFGRPTKVLKVYPQGRRQVWQVTLADGRTARCCDEHLWSYCLRSQSEEERQNRQFHTHTLREMRQSGLKDEAGYFKYLLPVCTHQPMVTGTIGIYLTRPDEIEYTNYIAIVDIAPCDKIEEMTCFYVDNDEHLFLTESFIVTHNTRLAVSDACYLAYPVRYEATKREWVQEGSSEKVLFIITEQTEEQIQKMIGAYLSDINESIFRYGNFDHDQLARLDVAAQIVEHYADNFIIEKMPNPTIETLKATVREQCLLHDIGYVFFDYIFIGPALLNEFRGFNLRNDELLLMMATALKDLAVELNVAVFTSTQVNASADDNRNIRGEACLAGGRSTINKADNGLICSRPTADELEVLKNIINKCGLPNMVSDVYKVRSGRYTQVRIWSTVDLGVMRRKDLFITDAQLNPVPDFEFNSPIIHNWSDDEYNEIRHYVALLNQQPQEGVEDLSTTKV